MKKLDERGQKSENSPSMNTKKGVIIHGEPGDSARAEGILRALAPTILVLFICGICVGATLPTVKGAVGTVAIAVSLVLLLLVARHNLRRLSSWFKGAHGEELTGFFLCGLPKGWHVFHDYPLACRIYADHIVAGPEGLFSIETKYWSGRVTLAGGKILVNGREPSRPPLEQAARQAVLTEALLGRRLPQAPSCTPILCFASDTFDGPPTKAGEILVCNVSDLNNQLMAGGGHLTEDELERIVKSLEQKEDA